MEVGASDRVLILTLTGITVSYTDSSQSRGAAGLPLTGGHAAHGEASGLAGPPSRPTHLGPSGLSVSVLTGLRPVTPQPGQQQPRTPREP